MRCVSMDRELYRRLVQGGPLDCRVAGVYQKAVNMLGPDRRMITAILNQAVPVPGGFSLFGLPLWEVQEGQVIRLAAGEAPSGLAITADDTTPLVDFTLPPAGPGRLPGPQARCSLAGFLRRHSPQGGIATLLRQGGRGLLPGDAPVPSGAIPPGADVLDRFLGCLVSGILPPETPVLGLGIGLTPSSDDFALGLLAVLHRYTSPLEPPLKECLRRQLSGTTPVSQEMLQNGLEDRFPLYISRLLEGLENPGPLAPGLLEEFLEHGHSSGMDMVYGVLWGVELLSLPGPGK